MILDFQNMSYKIPGGDLIYDDFSLRVFPGDFYGVLGRNGAGKSTLIEIVMGLRKLSSGRVFVFGENPESSSRRMKNKIFVISHDMLIPGQIALKDMFSFYAYFYPEYSKSIEEKLVSLFEINPHKKFGALSTGQKVKGMLCAAFAAKCELYLFDEVTAVLDPKSRKNFFEYLKEFRANHLCSMLLATNICEDLENSVDKVIFINEEQKAVLKGIESVHTLFDHTEKSA